MGNKKSKSVNFYVQKVYENAEAKADWIFEWYNDDDDICNDVQGPIL